MSGEPTLMMAAFGMTSSLILLLSLLIAGRRSKVETRLSGLSGSTGHGDAQKGPNGLAGKAVPKIGKFLTSDNQRRRNYLRDRLVRAGLYKRHSMATFLGMRFLLMVSPALLGMAAGSMGLVPIKQATIFGIVAGILGTIGPGFWLDHSKKKRQTSIRRSLPDALDVMVVCLEGGLSLSGAFNRVANELRTAHPLLASELNIVQREVQLGRSTGEALRQLADRFDVEELRSMSGVIQQAEKFGSSVIQALTVYADALRVKRHQNAEELAHKAGTKILFPTLLFIFPNIFLVLLAPAAFQIAELFRNMGL